MTRRRALTAALLTLTAVTVSVLAFRHFRQPWQMRAYYRLRLGMSKAQVEGILGPPQKSKTNTFGMTDFPPLPKTARRLHEAGHADRLFPGYTVYQWYDTEADWDICVMFDPDGKVSAPTCRTTPRCRFSSACAPG